MMGRRHLEPCKQLSHQSAAKDRLMPRLYSLVVKPSTNTPFVPPPSGEWWHVTHAALAEANAVSNYATLSFKTSDDVWISLGTLNSTGRDFMPLDLPLHEYTEFRSTGNVEVHITGALLAEEVGMEFDDDDDEAEAEEEILQAMMNGGRLKEAEGFLDDVASDETSEEEEPALQKIEEVAPAKLMGEASGLSKSAAKKLKKKQKKEAKQKREATEGPERQAKQQKIELAPAAEAKPKAAKSPQATPKKKKIRRFSNGFVIENLSYGPEKSESVVPGKTVTIKYKGTLEGGDVFDQSEKGFTFKYGAGEVVKGLDKGMDGMQVGDVRKLLVPAKMGYGSTGAEPAVPANANLIFEIELTKVE